GLFSDVRFADEFHLSMSAANDPRQQVEEAKSAFDRDFSTFDFLKNPADERLALMDLKVMSRGLNELRTRHLGKKSAIDGAKKRSGRVAAADRASFGQLVQKTEAAMTQSIESAEESLNEIIKSARTAREAIDVTIPGRRPRQGHLHPITLMCQRIEDIFVSLGYAVEDDREIETDFYNFDALNIPEGHPARDPQDTFYTT